MPPRYRSIRFLLSWCQETGGSPCLLHESLKQTFPKSVDAAYLFVGRARSLQHPHRAYSPPCMYVASKHVGMQIRLRVSDPQSFDSVRKVNHRVNCSVTCRLLYSCRNRWALPSSSGVFRYILSACKQDSDSCAKKVPGNSKVGATFASPLFMYLQAPADAWTP